MEEVKKQGMESLFCPYELALELKELGFDEISLFCYDTVHEGNPLSHCPHLLLNSQLEGFENEPISAPLYQQAFRWFRDVMLLDNFIIPYWFIDGEYKVKKYTYSIEPSNRFDEYFDCDSDQYDTYEEAEFECLVKLIDIVKKQNVK